MTRMKQGSVAYNLAVWAQSQYSTEVASRHFRNHCSKLIRSIRRTDLLQRYYLRGKVVFMASHSRVMCGL